MPHSIKQSLRKQAAATVLDARYRFDADKKIFDRLLPLLYGAQSVMCFFSTDREPSTIPLIKHLLSQGTKVALPRCEPSKKGLGLMSAVEVNDLDHLVTGPFGIPQPVHDLPAIRPSELDLIVMPCVASDKNGVRLGHGGGYYDRFLENIDCKTVCLCYDRLLFEWIPQEPHDRKPDCIVTENEVIWATSTASWLQTPYYSP